LPLVAAMRSSSWLFIVHYSSPSLAECNISFDFKAIIFPPHSRLTSAGKEVVIGAWNLVTR
jgi:hypothetical protein